MDYVFQVFDGISATVVRKECVHEKTFVGDACCNDLPDRLFH